MQKTQQVRPLKFKFISQSYSKFLQCQICKNLLISPMRLHPCGHTFCNDCIEANQNTNSKARTCFNQNCKRKYQLIQKDLTAERLIDQLKVKCLNEQCPWKGNYEDYKKYHLHGCKLEGGMECWLKSLVKGINKEEQIQNPKQSQFSEITERNYFTKTAQKVPQTVDKDQEQQNLNNSKEQQIQPNNKNQENVQVFQNSNQKFLRQVIKYNIIDLNSQENGNQIDNFNWPSRLMSGALQKCESVMGQLMKKLIKKPNEQDN